LAYRTRLFIDFWNFSLRWADHADGERVGWGKLPEVLLDEAQRQLQAVGLEEPLQLQETRVYGSYDLTEGGKRLRNWLNLRLSKEPSYQVRAVVRREKPFSLHCRRCGHLTEQCSNCDTYYRSAPEKGIDAAIVTDLVSLAAEDALDVAILVTTDADFVPPVRWLQDRGFAVVNATWANCGPVLENACWASFELDTLVPALARYAI
jgi:hypothetical protein